MFFDFDPWGKNAEQLNHIPKMLEFFNEPTEQGKLYINYPSIESFNDVRLDFNNYYFEYLKRGIHYKTVAGQLDDIKKPYSQIRGLTKDLLLNLFKFHLIKANYVCNAINELPDDIIEIEQLMILDKQIEFYQSESKIYVLSSIPLFLFELLGSKLLD